MSYPASPMMHHLSIPKDQMDDFCKRWKIAEMAIPGNPRRVQERDFGVFVRFDPTAEWSLEDRMRMQEELESLSGEAVSLHSRHGEALRRGKPDGMRLIYNA